MLEVLGVVLEAERDRLVLQQRVPLRGGEVAEELRDEDQPQRVVPRAPRVLIEPGAGGCRRGQLPTFLDDEEQPPRPPAGVAVRRVESL